MNDGTIGLGPEHEQRSDVELREIFVEAYEIVAPFLTPGGTWISKGHELMAHEAMSQRFPEITGMRLFLALSTIASVRASGRSPAA